VFLNPLSAPIGGVPVAGPGHQGGDKVAVDVDKSPHPGLAWDMSGGAEDQQGHRCVVVGVDGSPGCGHTLRVAATEAVLRSGALWVVRAWSIRRAARPPDHPAGSVPSVADYQKWLERDTRRLVEESLDRRPERIDVDVDVEYGAAARVLVDASVSARLLVVGSRSGSGRAGSVAEQCVRTAHCPVLVVRPAVPAPRTGGTAEASEHPQDPDASTVH
jgi:nucleotide-binding universal stress UspA family protein